MLSLPFFMLLPYPSFPFVSDSVSNTGVVCVPACAPQGVPNNYETDLIFPIVAKAAELAGLDYAAAPPAAQTALKVCATGAAAAASCRR
jgi:hypothetical protein